MPITVQIESERGDREGEPWYHAESTGILVGDHLATCCLRFIDPYGNTVFNQSQLPVLIDELRTLRGELRDATQVAVLDDLSEFLGRALGHVHTYVRFIGD